MSTHTIPLRFRHCSIFTAILGITVILLGTTASATPPSREGTAASLSSLSQSELWIPPIGSHLTVSDPYAPPPTPYTAGHRGIDLSAGPGLAVRAPTGGTVTFSGKVVDREVLSVHVDEHTVFSLEPMTSSLRAGDIVHAGEYIGTVSSGGHCFDECLHVGVRVEGEYVSPLRFFKGRPKLRPW